MTKTATIESLSHDGRGIARIEGKTTFVHGALPGEDVTLVVKRRHAKYDEGVAINTLVPSEIRTTPPCSAYEQCGGCDMQHFSLGAQRLHKEELLKQQLAQFANIEPQSWLQPIIGSPLNYRHKARLGVRYVEKKGGAMVGFRERGNSRYIADIATCPVLAKPVDELLLPLRELVNNLSMPQHIPQFEVAIGDNATALVMRHLKPLQPDDTDKLIAFAKQHDLWMYSQPGKLNSVKRIYPVDENELLNYRLPEFDLTLHFHPTDFTQINPEINRKMVSQAVELLDLQSSDRVLDLFCGLGNFTLAMALKASHVTGIEGDVRMVNRAKDNAVANGLDNTAFYVADLSVMPNDVIWQREPFDKILIDPPRTGAKAIVEKISRFNAKKIVMVSCNPSTLARDTAIICEQGYTLTKAGILDMFPQTSHVESMAVFDKS